MRLGPFKFFKSLSGRFLFGLLAINLVLGFVLFKLIVTFMSAHYQSQFVGNVRTQSYLLSSLVARDPSPSSVEPFLADLMLSGQVSIALFEAGKAQDKRPVWFVEDFHFGDHGDGVYHIAVPVMDSAGEHRGTLYLGFDETMVTERIVQARTSGLVIASAYTLSLLFLVGVWSIYLSRPLGRVGAWARKVAAGHFDAILDPGSRASEVTSLANDLDSMRAELLRRGDEIVEQETRYRVVLDNLSEGVFTISEDCKLLGFNPAACRIFGYAEDELPGKLFFDLAEDSEALKNSCHTLLAGQSMLFTGQRKNGEPFPMLLSVTSFQHGSTPLRTVVVQDFSERKRFEDQLSQMAYYDALTGLPNRRLFYDRLRQALALAERHAKLVGVLFLDLDRFKTINDTLGHETGDTLLRGVAERLSALVRKCDTVARLGGDEFTILLDDLLNVEDAKAVAEKIIDCLAAPFLIGEHELFASASIGITFFPIDGADTETLIKNADTAMYCAKRESGSNYQLYQSEMNLVTVERMNLEHSLRKAIVQENLQVYYQPQMFLHYQPQIERVSGEIIGAEALLRWHHPERGFISPDKFIPVAEETGLIIPIGEWVLKTACEQVANWQKAGHGALKMAVNLSARQLQHPGLVQQIDRILNATGVDPASLELEITESMILHNIDKIIVTLRELKARGFMISIDDFGTGHASLSNLQNLPVDTIKIDKSFVHKMLTDSGSAAIVRAVLQMAGHMGLRVVAEGVETEEQLNYLIAHGCSIIQGFYFSRAVPSEDFQTLIVNDLNTRNPLHPDYLGQLQ